MKVFPKKLFTIIGFLIGGVLGYYYAWADDHSKLLLVSSIGALFAIPGVFIGGLIGDLTPGKGYIVKDTIQVKTASPNEIKYILKRLKKKARFKD